MMSRDEPINESNRSASLDVSQLVKEEAARWREAAAANNWEVLEIPERAQTHDEQLRHAAHDRAVKQRNG